jgi:4-amino-4-deoxy-L-arabinose transferase-like glycosyltransferase
MLALARVPNLVLGTCLVGLIGWWAYRLWGGSAAILGMSLAAFEPNLIAHSSLLTGDAGITLFIFLTIYLMWEYSRVASRWLLVAIGISLGLALVTKFSSILLVGMIATIAGLQVLNGSSFASPGVSDGAEAGVSRRLMHTLVPALRILCIALLVILPFYYFQGYTTWSFGLKTQMNQQTNGKESFLLGQYSAFGWWYYFPACFLLKTPLGTLVLIIASLAFFRSGTPLKRQEAVFLLAPVVVYMLALTRLKLNIGFRYALPIYPFLFVLASRLATASSSGGWMKPVLIGVAVFLTAFSDLRTAPHQLAYFNELVGGPEEGYRYLSDSNIDWGQDLRSLKQYMDREEVPMLYLCYYGTAPPDYYGIRYQYIPGYGQLEAPAIRTLPENCKRELLAISVVMLQGVHCADKGLFQWLSLRRPIAKVGYSIFVYDLTADTAAHAELAQVYSKLGLPQLAKLERKKGGLASLGASGP